MPLYNFRSTFDAPGGLNADRVVWSWGLEAASMTFGEFSAIAGVVETTLVTNHGVAPAVNTLQTGFSLAFHEVFPAAGGEALHVLENVTNVVGSATAGPTEVQLVISRLISTPRGLAPKGRLYFGPCGSLTARRPSNPTCNALADWAEALHEGLVAVGATPVVLHDAGTPGVTGSEILGYRVDDQWDTQRRRGTEGSTFTAERIIA